MPSVGEMYPDRNSQGCSWRVEEIGHHTRLVYLRMWRDGQPTQSTMEWPEDRWPALVRSQLAGGEDEDDAA